VSPLRIAAVVFLVGCSGKSTGADAGDGGVQCCRITENPTPGECVELGGAPAITTGLCVTICGGSNDFVRTTDAKGCPMLVARSCPDADPALCPAQTIDAMQSSDAMLDHAPADGGSDAAQSGDAMTDRPLADGGSDAGMACFAPSDCAGGQVCCVMFNASGSGVVSCQPSALCVPDDFTWLACAVGTDCPASLPTCTEISTTPQGRPFSICR